MGAKVVIALLLASPIKSSTPATIQPNPELQPQLEPTKGLFIGALPLQAPPKPIDVPVKAASSNYVPYGVLPLSQEDALNNPNTKSLDIAPVDPGEYSNIGLEVSDVESDADAYNDEDLRDRDTFVDTTGYNQYESHTSFNLEGPKQLETIDTKSYHKEVEPFATNEYSKHHHKEQEEHAEVHYHQHKHLHKHQHKQDHVHKHKEEHKHQHGHKHKHEANHDHKHQQDHQHHHHSEHKHNHHNHHEHQHKQKHKHEHHHGHQHKHKHQEEHKHKQEHKHKHDHWSDHKHKHWNDHKHDHHHGHKHTSDHKHEHKHDSHHNHKHGHKHEHKHSHHESSHHFHHKEKW
ncbi:hypothetical protein D910_08738 [Dendroctonus ponderosae]|uniref:Uncharacterized protein n=1 Tax=Dendroctonus ponderosae TaxID=77166 RepID=U4UMN0_DENPD|nr:hypothetical protein D910_08738 [Dendroctonus ponderosae]